MHALFAVEIDDELTVTKNIIHARLGLAHVSLERREDKLIGEKKKCML